MNRLVRQLRPLTCALAGVNLLLVFLIAQRIWDGTSAATLIATAAKPYKPTDAHITVPSDGAVDFSPLQEHALFHATRSYFIPPPPSSAPAAPPRPDYRFVGTFVIPNKPALAMLSHNATGGAKKVKVGDDLEGWVVHAVDSQRVVLQFGTESIEIAKSSGSGAGAGLQAVPLARGDRSASSGGTRVLGSSRSPVIANPVQSQANGAPRLYRPPPSR